MSDCDTMNCSTPGFPVPHHLPEYAQAPVPCVGEAIQPSHPLSSPSPPAFNLSPASGSFQMSQFVTSGGWSIEVSASASVLPVNIQDWFPLGLTGLISLQSKGFSIYDGVITLADNGVCTYVFFCALESSELVGLRY